MSFRAGSMIARASSGSRSCSSSVDPLMSANSAVTVLRSASIKDASACSAATRIAEVGTATASDLPEPSVTPSGAAHSPQNFAVGAFSYPHFAQRLLKGAAHSLQNFCSAGFSAPQFAHFISNTQLVEQILGVLQVGGVESPRRRRSGRWSSPLAKPAAQVSIDLAYSFQPVTPISAKRRR